MSLGDVSAGHSVSAMPPGAPSQDPFTPELAMLGLDEETGGSGDGPDRFESVQLHDIGNGQKAEVLQMRENPGEERLTSLRSIHSPRPTEALLRSLPSSMMLGDVGDASAYEMVSRNVPPPQPPSREGLKDATGFTPVQNRPKTSARPSTQSSRPDTSSSSEKKAPDGPRTPTPTFSLGAIQPAVVRSRPKSVALPSASAPSWVQKVSASQIENSGVPEIATN
jgi:hypothetical protein